MSVQDKLTEFEAYRDEVRSKHGEFVAYTDEFSDDAARKTDTEELEATIDELRHEFATTRGVFDEYNGRFAADVRTKRDTSQLDAAIAQFRDEFETTSGLFSAYAHIFRGDVERMRDTSDLEAAIRDLRASFASTSHVFDEYGQEFERLVGQHHQSVDDTRAAMEATRREFRAYSDEIQPDIEAIQTPVDLLDAIDRMGESFTATRGEFEAFATGRFQDQMAAFRTECDEMQSRHRDVERQFADYTDEFYGVTDPSTAGSSTQDAESATTSTGSSTRDADSETTSTDAVPIETEDFGGSTTEPEPSSPETDTASETETDVTEDRSEDDTDDQSGSDTDDAASTTETDPEEDAPEGMIHCRICGEYYKAITEPHLQTHDMTIDDYRDEFGDDTPLRPGDEA